MDNCQSLGLSYDREASKQNNQAIIHLTYTLNQGRKGIRVSGGLAVTRVCRGTLLSTLTVKPSADDPPGRACWQEEVERGQVRKADSSVSGDGKSIIPTITKGEKTATRACKDGEVNSRSLGEGSWVGHGDKTDC